MLSERARQFIDSCRVAHLATADRDGAPHVMPVCFGLARETLYIAIDEKPKRSDRPLKRLRNILDNPRAAIVFDRYDEDWTRLAWVMVRGTAEVLIGGDEHARAQALVRARYAQLRVMRLEALPVIALRIDRVTTWGDVSASGKSGAAPTVG
ncbi:MAG TPA: TIGR03668 family PPOX class F420-dependent oxidoreductase [Vineibacter sp.]|nr:TIGR03668 family PPOX class F420-dependent oxidoreductase [Vineibacter sp.]